MPITRPDQTDDKFSETSLVSRDIIATVLNSARPRRVDDLLSSVELYSRHRYVDRRFIALNEMNAALKNSLSQIPAAQTASRSELSLQIANYLQKHLDAVLYTTNAHSISLRLFHPSSLSLQRVAFSSADPSREIGRGRYADIPIKGNAHRSVNVFTYLDGGARHPYVYLPQIAAPADVRGGKRRKATFPYPRRLPR